MPRNQVITDALGEMAAAAARVATYCDRVEHVEQADVSEVARAAATMRSVAVRLADQLAVDVFSAYGQRLDEVEGRFVLGLVDGFRGSEQIGLAETWRDLQLIQGQHDRLFRPDVHGLARADQLGHCCLHITKLLGRFVEAEQDIDTFISRWLPDTLLIGIKLSTIVGEVLPTSQLPRRIGKAASMTRSATSPAP